MAKACFFIDRPLLFLLYDSKEKSLESILIVLSLKKLDKVSSLMEDYEKLGLFYLGKEVESEAPFLLESKDFTTHAVCVGMTGSGKTGLGIILLEEAALDGIPAIIIDPKGDMGNLMLSFPDLKPDEFLPWVDSEAAKRKGETPEKLAEDISKTWKKGLEESDEPLARIKKFKESVDITIYTPGSTSGVSVSILSSFEVPSKELFQDSGAIRDKVSSLTTGLLSLIGITEDALTSKEHILISTIIDYIWKSGKNLDLPSLIQLVEKPPFEKVGVFDLNTFFPPKDRLELSLKLNALLASPSFTSWMQGEPIDIAKMLYTKEGKPKFSIFSINHLGDKERMFFVTLLLNEVIAWTRKQSGTTSLRAILYMDEIFGFFPPIANPPSKIPMLTLLKQARAFGVGCILATQNPVDLDYKGLSNAGTWFIGKMQTERDKLRVLEGLKTASDDFGRDTKSIDTLLSSIANRTFLVRSIYHEAPVVFKTRFTLCYLRGPLSLPEIAKLMKSKIQKNEEGKEPVLDPLDTKKTGSVTKPLLSSQIQEFFFRSDQTGNHVTYKPLVAGFAKLHFVDAKNGIDYWKDISIVTTLTKDGTDALWGEGSEYKELRERMGTKPIDNSFFETLNANLMQEKTYKFLEKTFSSWLYQNYNVPLLKAPSLKLTAKQGESEEEFKARVAHACREKRDEIIENLKAQFNKKITQLESKIQKADAKVAKEKEEASLKKAETYVSIGTTILGSIFGKKSVTKGTITGAGSSIQKARRMQKQNQDVEQAEGESSSYKEELQNLQSDLESQIAGVSFNYNDDLIEKIEIKPRKSDINIEKVILLWWPIFS